METSLSTPRVTLKKLVEGRFYQCYSDPREAHRRMWREAPDQCLHILRDLGDHRYYVVILEDGGALRRTTIQFFGDGFWDTSRSAGFFEPVDVTSDYEIRRFRAAGVRFWRHSHPPIRNLQKKEHQACS